MRRRNKKTNLKMKYLIVISLILTGALILGFISIKGDFFTIFYIEELSCAWNQDSTISCSTGTSASMGNEFAGSEPNQILELVIGDGWKIFHKQFYNFVPIISKSYPGVSKFFSENELCQTSGGYYRLRMETNKPTSEYLDKYVYQYSICSDTEEPAWNVGTTTTIQDLFPNQLIIVEGNIQDLRDNPSNIIPFKTYGLCNFTNKDGDFNGARCYVHSPAVSLNEFPRSHGIITSIKIIPKIGGYEEDKVCLDYGIEKCIGTNYYVCDEMYWVNKGETDGKCNYVECPEGQINCDGICKKSCEEENNWKWYIFGGLLSLSLIIILYLKYWRKR